MLNNKIALVTGASRGIGKAIVLSLINANVQVIGTSLNKKKLDLFNNSLSIDQKKLFYPIAADLTKDNDINSLCKHIVTKFKSIDIIINNAGVLTFEFLQNINDEMLKESYEINVFAPFKLTRQFVPYMIKKQWGRIVNICSSSAYFGGGTPKHCLYVGTKHALLGFSRALDDELRQHNIRVGTVSPAGVNTEMISTRSDLEDASLMDPEEVAEAVMYLLAANGKGIVYEIRLWRFKR